MIEIKTPYNFHLQNGLKVSDGLKWGPPTFFGLVQSLAEAFLPLIY